LTLHVSVIPISQHILDVNGSAFEQGAANSCAAPRANWMISDVLHPIRIGIAARCEMECIGLQFVNKGEVSTTEVSGSFSDGIKYGPQIVSGTTDYFENFGRRDLFAPRLYKLSSKRHTFKVSRTLALRLYPAFRPI
jgi:hypothetical protein